MFRLRDIIRLFVEPYRRYITYSAYFGIPKIKDTGKILPISLNVNFLEFQNMQVKFYLYV